MREPIALGYLLARASDTIADTEGVPASLREECLRKFTPALKDKVQRAELLQLIQSEFLAYQQEDDEKLLLKRLGDVYAWYDTESDWAWKAISVVIDHIVEGQMHDIQHFELLKKGKLDTAKELETYCYQVAGSVGEFWSVVGFASSSQFSNLPRTELEKLGREYGMGLQLVNILRDLPKDLAAGRCYLPVKDVTNLKEVRKEAKHWRKIARQYLKSGLKYAGSLRKWRARIATVLPALIAERTLDLLDKASWDQLKVGVKVDRKEVRRCLKQALFFPKQ